MIVSKILRLIGGLLACGIIGPVVTARADLVIAYTVNIVQDGPVPIGSVIDWEIFVTVSGDPLVGVDNGIQTAAIDLQDSTGDMLNPGVIQNGGGQPFDDYSLSNPGFWTGTKLQNIGASQFNVNSQTVGEPGDLGPHLLASGSYTVTTVGLHTLSTVTSASISRYYSDNNMPFATATPYDDVRFGNDVAMGTDTILVTAALPEPASLAMMGVACCSALAVRLRRRNQTDRQHSSFSSPATRGI